MYFIKSTRTLSLLIVGIGLAVNGYSQSFLTNGLVAYYPFNGNANDASGNRLDATMVGNVPLDAPDRRGEPSAALFTDPSGWISVPVFSQEFLQRGTVSFWMRLEDYHESVWGWTVFCLSRLNPDGSGDRVDLLNIGAGFSPPELKIDQFAFGRLGMNGWVFIRSQNELKGSWHNLLASWEASEMRLYIDGALIGVNSVDLALEPVRSIRIGMNSYPTGNYLGRTDDVRIYNRALSSNEVEQLYAVEFGRRVDLIKAVKPSFSYLSLGANYQLQVSSDMNTWTNQGAAFTATNSSMVYPQYWDVDNWSKLFFRLQVSP